MNLKKSLKPIKNKLQNKNRLYHTIKRLYTHLSELSNEEILDYYNVNSLKELEEHIEHIKEILKKQTQNHKEEREELGGCFCVDSRGDFKYLYEHKKKALKQIDYSMKIKCVKLILYACPFHRGWHLSKI
ncbi:MAG: hypothetical protein HF962_05330 [Sulfurovum sp.]|nr:hypothetical protein [Sulfurovum sp.]